MSYSKLLFTIAPLCFLCHSDIKAVLVNFTMNNSHCNNQMRHRVHYAPFRFSYQMDENHAVMTFMLSPCLFILLSYSNECILQ